MSIMGLFMLAIAAALIYFYTDWETANRVSMAEATMRDIKLTVDGVYSSGPGRRETITIRVPTGVERTQASDGLLDMVLVLPGGGVTEVLEVTSAPVKGYIPSVDGVHQLTVEYVRSGYVVLGGGLVITPSLVELGTTADNVTSFMINVSNVGDRDLPAVKMSVGNSTPVTFQVNESGFGLMMGEGRPLLVSVRTPVEIMPGSFVDYIRAEGGGLYSESMVDVDVGGAICGDGVLSIGEECDTRSPFAFPDVGNPFCHNPSSGVRCDEADRRYSATPPFGDCDAGCLCHRVDAAWVTCGIGCNDPNYCNNCAHCLDNASNCGETQVDGGGACPTCDGIGDIGEGFVCVLGSVQPCGVSDCIGTQTCDGPRCSWGSCSTYGIKCQTKKCCICSGDPHDPSPAYDRSFNSDCTPSFDQTTCGNPGSCQGGTYRGACSGLDSCSPDWGQSVWPMASNHSLCIGQPCHPEVSSCYQATYPCRGNRTTYSCADSGSCQAKTVDDHSACSETPTCQPPQTIILHKLDGNVLFDYVDAPASTWAGVGVYYQWPDSCKDSQFSHTTLTHMYYTEPGAYAPYQNGTLSFYGKAWHLSGDFYHDDCSWYATNCPLLGYGANVRIGTDATNYLQYQAPVWSPNWQRGAIDLKTPQYTVGNVDWDDIRFLQFNYIVGRECQPTDTGCESCVMWLDYATLSR